MNEKNTKGTRAEHPEYFSLKDFFEKCLGQWKWFVISVACFMLLGGFYCITRQPTYERYTEVLVKDQESGGGFDISNAFAAFGFGGGNTSVNNELISFKSPALMTEVVQRLNLTMNYVEREFPHGTTLYGPSLPYLISFPDLHQEQGAFMRFKLYPDGSAEMFKFRSKWDGEKIKSDEVIKLAPGQTMAHTPLGRVTVLPNPRCPEADRLPEDEPVDIKVVRYGLLSAVELYSSKLDVDMVDTDSEVIKLGIRDVSKLRADEILSTLIDLYNSNWVENNNLTAVSTSKFIDDRLKVIEEELGIVDNDISAFQTAHKVIDPRQMAEAQLTVNANIEDNMLKLHNELAMTSFLGEYLANPANQFAVIPVNAGFQSPQLETQIAAYNQLLLARNSLVENSSSHNPIAVDYDRQLDGMRESIAKAVVARQSQLTASLRTMQTAHNDAQGVMASTPEQAKYLQTVGRQQRVKESLYLYLLERREENELTQSFIAYNTRVITPPTGPLRPVAPKTTTIMFVAFFMGLVIPGAIVYTRFSSDTKVHTRRDIDGAGVPFVGEVPEIRRPRRLANLFRTARQRRADADKPLVVVQQGQRDIPNESFRVVRSNLEFMIGRKGGHEVVMLTSFNPGSGKSFVAYNLAKTFALKGKHVLLVDCDLRRGSTSGYVGTPAKGLTNYLTGHVSDWRGLVVSGDTDDLSVMPMGPMPPNPAELLDSERFEDFIKQAREQYDLVILDCPPVELVVDTQIISQHADRTVFVIRAGLLEKGALPEINELYTEQKYRNMSLLLNGITAENSRYGAYGNKSYGSYGN